MREGVLWPLFITSVVLTVLAVLGLFIVRKPQDLLASLTRAHGPALPGGIDALSHEIAPPPNQFDEPPVQELPVSFSRTEIRELTFNSNQRVKIRPRNPSGRIRRLQSPSM